MSSIGPEGSATVLLVDDDDSVRAFVYMILRREGYRVLTAATGEAALDLAGAFDGPIHLLLSDVRMPGMDGLHLASALCEVRPGTQVVLMSGWTGQELNLDKDWIFMHKPLVPRACVQTLKAALAGVPSRAVHRA